MMQRYSVYTDVFDYIVREKDADGEWVKFTDAQDEVSRLTAELAEARAALEVYHSLPNSHNRIGDKRSRKGHARDAWLRAFGKADREARAILARIDQRKESRP